MQKLSQRLKRLEAATEPEKIYAIVADNRLIDTGSGKDVTKRYPELVRTESDRIVFDGSRIVIVARLGELDLWEVL